MMKKKKKCYLCKKGATEILGCKHKYCLSCLQDYLHDQFDVKRKSFLELRCAVDRCDFSFNETALKKYATETTYKNVLSVYKTIPSNPQDPNLSLDDFCYHYNDQQVLVHKETGDRFHWVNQIHYDLLGDLIIPYIQKKMVSEFNMKEVFLPVDDNHLSNFQKNNIFLTDDALTNPNRLILLIQGSGAVRAGQWARALTINDSLHTGSIFPYLKQAKENGYGVIVFNPNLNTAPKKELSNRPTRDQFFIPGKPKPKPYETINIPKNESPLKHTFYVWDEFASKAAAKEIVIIAHSAGGHCTVHLLKEKWNEISPKLKAIGFTDSAHSLSPNYPKEIKNFLKENAINWVQSDDPVDTPCPSTDGVTTCVSSGHSKHEYTSEFARESLFKFINSKVTPILSSTLKKQEEKKEGMKEEIKEEIKEEKKEEIKDVKEEEVKETTKEVKEETKEEVKYENKEGVKEIKEVKDEVKEGVKETKEEVKEEEVKEETKEVKEETKEEVKKEETKEEVKKEETKEEVKETKEIKGEVKEEIKDKKKEEEVKEEVKKEETKEEETKEEVKKEEK